MKSLVTIVGFVLVLLVVSVFARIIGDVAGRSLAESKIEDGLAQTAEQINRSLPAAVDAETRLDKVVAGPDMLLTFQYTLVNYPSAEKNPPDISSASADVATKACADSATREMLARGVSVAYVYKDNSGNEMFRNLVQPRHCGQ